MENLINDSNLDDILLDLENQLKEVKNKIKERDKPKTITISNFVHSKLKEFCQLTNNNIGQLTEQIILQGIEKLGDKLCIESVSKEILEKELIEKVLERNKITKPLFKSNVNICSKNIHFMGYSILDGLPIYSAMDEGMIDTIKELYPELLIKSAGKSEITKNLKTIQIEDVLVVELKEI